MDLKKLAIFVLVIGVVVIAYAGIHYLKNLPEEFDPAESRVDPLFGRMDLSNQLDLMSRNTEHEFERKKAVKELLYGFGIMIIGIGVLYSKKKDKD